MTPENDGSFPATHWTLVARIKSADEAVAGKALEELCAQYHYPLYCYLRRRGCDHHDAQDVLHDFLLLVFRRRSFDRLEEANGRLRGWLATSLGRHLNEWRQREGRREQTTGEFDRVLDFEAIEHRYLAEHFSDTDTPDRVFERNWAIELLRHVIDTLGARYEARGRGALFVALRPVLEAGGTLRGADSPALAASLGMRDDALRAALARLLREFREAVQSEVRLTVESQEDVPDELAYLMGLFQRP
jgi:RNA polymerase sigma-70 factor (ECF subfamily)